MAHSDLHPEFNPDCMGCKLLTLNIGAGALENKGAGVRREDAREKQLDKDLRGYREMRDGGLQPRMIDGSSEVVKTVNSQFDIDLGRVVPKGEESRVRESFAWVEEQGV